jgi:hypothetical protein
VGRINTVVVDIGKKDWKRVENAFPEPPVN